MEDEEEEVVVVWGGGADAHGRLLAWIWADIKDLNSIFLSGLSSITINRQWSRLLGLLCKHCY